MLPVLSIRIEIGECMLVCCLDGKGRHDRYPGNRLAGL